MSINKMVPVNLNVVDYEYPPEKEALQRLSREQDLKYFCEYYIKEYSEPWINGLLTGNSIKISKKQLPELYNTVEAVSNILDIPAPQVFLEQNPFLNAYTYGANNQNLMVITHSLYEQLDENSLYYVIGHELGHVKSNHVVYMTLIKMLIEGQLPWKRKIRHELLMLMLDWQRKAEITADRAGLLVTQNIEVASRTLLTLATGSKTIAAKIEIQDYIESHMLSLEYNPIGQQSQFYQTHPFIPFRINEIIKFYNSSQYRNIVSKSITLNVDAENLDDVEVEIE